MGHQSVNPPGAASIGTYYRAAECQNSLTRQTAAYHRQQPATAGELQQEGVGFTVVGGTTSLRPAGAPPPPRSPCYVHYEGHLLFTVSYYWRPWTAARSSRSAAIGLCPVHIAKCPDGRNEISSREHVPQHSSRLPPHIVHLLAHTETWSASGAAGREHANPNGADLFYSVAEVSTPQTEPVKKRRFRASLTVRRLDAFSVAAAQSAGRASSGGAGSAVL